MVLLLAQLAHEREGLGSNFLITEPTLETGVKELKWKEN